MEQKPTGSSSRVVDDPQIARLDDDDRQPFGGGEVGKGDHELPQVHPGVGLADGAQRLPEVHPFGQVRLQERKPQAPDAVVARIRVEVVQEDFQAALLQRRRGHFEHEVFVEN